MKKFSSTTKANSRRIFRNTYLFRTLGIFGVLLLALFLAPRIVALAASFVMAPVVRFEMWITESSGFIPSYLRDRNDLLDTQADLRRQLAEHAAADLTATRLIEENESLRSLLNATSTENIAAGVIGRPTALPYDVLLIDRGSRDGIVQNAPVYIGDDHVIGFVGAVYEQSSVVVLATTPGLTSTVYVYGPNIYTNAVGMGSGSLRISVPQGIVITEGNPVVMPSLDAGIYGTISYVDSVPSRPEQYGYVSIEEPLASIRYVRVGNRAVESIPFETAKSIVDTVRAEMLMVEVPNGVLVDATTDLGTSTPTSTPEEPISESE